MKSRFYLFAAILLVLGLAGPDLESQYQPGDVAVVGNDATSDVLLGVRPGGAVYTISTMMIGTLFSPQFVAPSPDNQSLWVLGSSLYAGEAIQVASDGTVTSLFQSFQCHPCSFDVDEHGTPWIADMFNGALWSYAQGTLTSVYRGFTGGLGACATDLGTGDLVTCDMRSVYRLRLVGSPATVHRVGGLPVAKYVGLHADPTSGHTLVSAANQFLSVNLNVPNPVLTTVWAHAASTLRLGRMDRHPTTGLFPVAGCFCPSPIPPYQPYLFQFDAKAQAITTLVHLNGLEDARAATVIGSRNLTALGPARVGQPFCFRLSFPGQWGSPYVAALSFGFRPGLAIAGRTIHLQPDALFFASLLGSGIFQNFQGYLTTAGEAFPQVALPNLLALRGQRFYAVAVTLGPHGVSGVSDPLGVTIR